MRGERLKGVRRGITALNRRSAAPRHSEIPSMGGDLHDLVAWRQAAALAREAIGAARRIRGVGAATASDQLARAAESIPANIAEAYGRGLGKDGARFLRIARGSATELESHLWIAGETGRLPVAVAAKLMRDTRTVRALLRGLILASARTASRS